jgi:hypothetical protein
MAARSGGKGQQWFAPRSGRCFHSWRQRSPRPRLPLRRLLLLRSSPRDGQVLERSPRAVVLTFDEGIEAAFVRLRVQDSSGRGLDSGEPYHPQDRDEQLAVRLRRGTRAATSPATA